MYKGLKVGYVQANYTPCSNDIILFTPIVYIKVFAMSSVISIRIPRKLKEELEKLDINYTALIKEYLEELVRREKARRLKEAMEDFKASIQPVDDNLAAELIREDRDAR